MTEAMQAPLPVTQSDREAAAPFANCLSDMQDIFDGKADGLPVVQAFARHRQAHSLPGDVGTEAEAWLRAISSWLLANDHDMTLPSGVLDTDPLDIADRLAALTPSPCPGDGMREALSDIFAAWDAHVEAIDATRAERAVYDERYRASEEAKREWYRAMHRFIDNPATRAALTPSALSGDAGEGERLRAARNDAFLAGYAAGERGDGLDYSLDKFDVEGADHG